ncbi:hypothetical protein EROM_030660 [Encephalitozoon romaleae SJ-2008]|uniref:Uncharacterized protein n=1 Tax=Encephalitozoon romaleae (strain SJ-2008) TaxID=1178016 RepID=I7AQV5_ENCRO|nr:hypothetical protein EROM_030660 [Encephalitozoon romaleae SJ-2008]AFN82687.1 hypothetical protein EROM_030660 [Encephalitozoon romaleae SJ-2008]
MKVDLDRLNELCKVRFEREYTTYGEYFGSIMHLTKEEGLREMFFKYIKGTLSEEEVLSRMGQSSPNDLKHFSKIYEYEKGFCKKKAALVLKRRYMEESDYDRDAVFQCIRRLSNWLDFGFVKDICNDEYLGLIIGEYARKHELDESFLDEIANFLPSVFFGYTRLNNLLLDSFEKSFERVIGRNLEILHVVDYLDRRVVEAISRSRLKKDIFEYLVSNELIEEDVLLMMIGAVGSIDTEVFLSDGVIGKLCSESIVKYLDSVGVEKVVEIAIAGCRCKKLYGALPSVLEKRIEGFMKEPRIVDVLLVMVYYDSGIRFGSFLSILKPSLEREFLVSREEEKRKVVVDVNKDTGEIREIGVDVETTGVFSSEGGEFRFVGKGKAEEKDVAEYLREICTDSGDFLTNVRRKLGFACFLEGPTKPTFDQLVMLPGYYFAESLKRYCNEFLGLLYQFNEIVVPRSRRRDLIARTIVANGYKELFVRYLVKRDRYFRIEIDLDVWLEKMTSEYKAKYFQDYPMAIIGREEKVVESLKDDIQMLLPIVVKLESKKVPREVIDKIRKHISMKEGFYRKEGEVKRHGQGRDDAIKKEETNKWNESMRIDTTKKGPGEWKPPEKRVKTESCPSEDNIYDDWYPIEKVDHVSFRKRVGFICNEINKRISGGNGLHRAGLVTSMVVRDVEMARKVLSVLQGVNRFGKEFVNFIEFFTFFLSYCKMEVSIDATTLKTLRRYISEEDNDSVLYFVFVKVKLEEMETLFSSFKEKSFDVVYKALVDRIRGVKEGTTKNTRNGCTAIKVGIPQPVIKRKKGKGTEINTVEIWNSGDQEERIRNVIGLFLSSDDECMHYIGLEGLNVLDLEVSVERFLDSRSDRVVEAALKVVIKRPITPAINSKFMEILYRRGRLDNLGKMCLRAVNIDILEKEDVDRIYEMFFIDPGSYLEVLPRIIERGYEPTEEIIMELIGLVGQSQCDDTIGNAMKVLKSTEYTEEMVFKSILVLENAKFAPKMFLIEKICRSSCNLNTRSFLKLCVCIGNEENYDALKGLLEILRKKGINADIVEKWKESKSLNRLMVRIYPLSMKDKPYYKRILDEAKKDAYEWNFINEFYRNELKVAQFIYAQP